MTSPVITKLILANDDCIADIKLKGFEWVDKMLKGILTYTQPGSLFHLLYGTRPSQQSISIKMGRFGEDLAKNLISSNKNLELLHCGVQDINGKNKDVDLIWRNKITGNIFYRELKANIELDTEKLPATVKKCKDIEENMKKIHPSSNIDSGILNWSVYDREILIKCKAGLSNIKSFEKAGIKIDHMGEFLKVIDISWQEEDFYSYFREIGIKIESFEESE